MINKFINDDCFNVLPKIADKSINLIFSGIPDLSQTGDKYNLDIYKNMVSASCKEFSRIVKDDGFVLMMQTDRKLKGTIFPKQDLIKKAMDDGGLKLYQHKIYVKNSIDRKNLFQLNYANVLIFTRKGKIKQDRISDFLQDVFIYEYDSFGTFDIRFVNKILHVFTNVGDVVLDPFAGSGTVCLCARDMDRKYIGIEYDKYIYDSHKSKFNNFLES